MTTYMVNATMTLCAWTEVEAENEAEAMELAEGTPASQFEYDLGSAEVEFNASPQVVEMPF